MEILILSFLALIAGGVAVVDAIANRRARRARLETRMHNLVDRP